MCYCRCLGLPQCRRPRSSELVVKYSKLRHVGSEQIPVNSRVQPRVASVLRFVPKHKAIRLLCYVNWSIRSYFVMKSVAVVWYLEVSTFCREPQEIWRRLKQKSNILVVTAIQSYTRSLASLCHCEFCLRKCDPTASCQREEWATLICFDSCVRRFLH